MRFWVNLDMDRFAAGVKDIPPLRKWCETNLRQSEPHLVTIGPSDTRFYRKWFEQSRSRFDFDSTHVLHVNDGMGRVYATGPVLRLDYPNANRLCALFLPYQLNPLCLAPLMPPPGTYHLPANIWKRKFIREHRCSEKQAETAVETLNRCGHARVIVDDPFRKEIEWVLSTTIQGPGNDLRPGPAIRTSINQRVKTAGPRRKIQE
jgi:hypothetical protein